MILEKGEGREREGEKHRSVAFYMHRDWSPNLQPRPVGNQTRDLSVYRSDTKATETHWPGSPSGDFDAHSGLKI